MHAAIVADGDGVAGDLDLTGKATMHAIMCEHMRVGLDAAGTVDGDGNHVPGNPRNDPWIARAG